MSAYLVVSAIGQDRPGIVDEVSAFVFAHQCNVEDSRMAVLGGDFALIMLVSGPDTEVEKFSGHLPELEKNAGNRVDMIYEDQRGNDLLIWPSQKPEFPCVRPKFDRLHIALLIGDLLRQRCENPASTPEHVVIPMEMRHPDD